MAEEWRPTLVLDFDGVCHSYVSGWKGVDVIPDPPVVGLFPFLSENSARFQIVIYSTRSKEPAGRVAMLEWFHEHETLWREQGNMDAPEIELEFAEDKPAGWVTLDDRALTFTGRWPSTEELLAFQPWYKEGQTVRIYSPDCVDLLEEAWGIIANVSGGDWTLQIHVWQKAAAAWRDKYHKVLEQYQEAGQEAVEE